MLLSPKQKYAIAKSNKQINIWHGAVRSGKTYSSLIRFLIEVDEAPPGEMAIICRDAFAFRRNILPLLFQLIGNDTRYLEGKGLLEIWNRKIHVIGAHDTRAEGKIRGATFVGAYVDEASLIPHSAWIILLQRCAMGNARIFATTNPDSPAHWLKKDFLTNNPDVQDFHFTMLDNPALTPQDREYLERQHKGIFYKRFVLGEWCLAEGAIFDFFDESIHTISRQPANAKFYLCGVDIGFTNPTAFILIGYNDDVSPCLWVEDEYYWDSKERGSKTDSEYAVDLNNFVSSRHNVQFIYVDPAAASFKTEMRRCNIGVHLKDANNDVLEGIRSISTLLANGDLKILCSCRKLISEIQSYCWDSKAAEKGYDAPLKRFDHAIDSMRYALFSYFGERVSIKQAKPVTDARTLGHHSLVSFKGPAYPSSGTAFMPDAQEATRNPLRGFKSNF